MHSLWSFALFMALGQFSPGPDMLLIMKNSLNHSRRAALFTVLGIGCGVVLHVGVALAGLAVLVTRWPGVRMAGGAYLLYLGLRLLWSVRRAGGGVAVMETGTAARLGDGAAFAQGFFTNLTNLKVVAIFSSLIAAWLPAGSPPWRGPVLGGIIIGQAFGLWTLFVCLLHWEPLRVRLLAWDRGLNAIFGLLLAGVGVSVFLG